MLVWVSGLNFKSCAVQVAGTTLDAGVKIYAKRVDGVHLLAYDTLQGFTRAGRKPAAEDEDGALAAAAGPSRASSALATAPL